MDPQLAHEKVASMYQWDDVVERTEKVYEMVREDRKSYAFKDRFFKWVLFVCLTEKVAANISEYRNELFVWILAMSFLFEIWQCSSCSESNEKRSSWSTFINTIDYRCEDGRFPVSASCVTILIPDSLWSRETMVYFGIKSWKKHLSDWARCQKAVGGIYFTNKWRAETLQPGLGFHNFKPRLQSSIFKCISWLNGSFFGGDDWGISKEGVKTYLMAPMSPLNKPTFCLSSHL